MSRSENNENEITPYQQPLSPSIGAEEQLPPPLSPLTPSQRAPAAAGQPRRFLLDVKGATEAGSAPAWILRFVALDGSALQTKVVCPSPDCNRNVPLGSQLEGCAGELRKHFGIAPEEPVMAFVAAYAMVPLEWWQAFESPEIRVRVVSVLNAGRMTEAKLLAEIARRDAADLQNDLLRATRHYRRVAAAKAAQEGAAMKGRWKKRKLPSGPQAAEPARKPRVTLVESSPSPIRGKRARTDLATATAARPQPTPQPRMAQTVLQMRQAPARAPAPALAAFDYPCFGLWQELHELRCKVPTEQMRITITDRASCEILKGLDTIGLGREEYKELVNSVKLASNFVASGVSTGSGAGSGAAGIDVASRPPYGAINVNLLSLITKRMQGAARAIGF